MPPLPGYRRTFIDLPSSTGKNLSVWATFDGFLGDVQVAARLGLDGSELDLAADVPRARPEAVRAFFPAWPIFDDVSAHVEAKGPPDDLRRGLDHGGGGRVDARGALSIGECSTKLTIERATSTFARSSRGAPGQPLGLGNGERCGARWQRGGFGGARDQRRSESTRRCAGGIGHRQARRRFVPGKVNLRDPRAAIGSSPTMCTSPRGRAGRRDRLDRASARDLARAVARQRRQRSSSMARQGTNRARCDSMRASTVA